MSFFEDSAGLIQQLKAAANDCGDIELKAGIQHTAFEGGVLCWLEYCELVMGAEEWISENFDLIEIPDDITVSDFITLIDDPVAFCDQYKPLPKAA